MQLRDYQCECLAAMRAAWERVDRALVVMATGLGKTVVFGSEIHDWRERGQCTQERPAVVIAHREELLQQAGEKLSAIDPWVRLGLERAGERAPRSSEVILASVQTVGRKNDRLAGLRPSLVVVDEAHHVAATSYQTALDKLGCFDPSAGVKTLGVTATPHRLDNKRLSGGGGTFQEEVFRYDIRAGIDGAYLSDLRGYLVQSSVNLDQVATRGGDFVDTELAKAVRKEERTLAAIREWQRVANGRKTIVFCADVAHAEETAALWAGATPYRAICVHGGLEPAARRAAFDLFRSGVVPVLCNVDIATEGFDEPSVSCIVILRPTKSWSRYVQMVGRGTRLAPGKEDCVVLDVADVSTKHSLCTVPAILNLPPKLDLKGGRLSEAAKLMDKVSGSALKEAVKQTPKSLDELATLVTQIDLFEGARVPQELDAVARYAWVDSVQGYRLSTGQRDTFFEVLADTLGHYELLLRAPGEPVRRIGASWPNAEAAIARGEMECDKRFPDAKRLVARSSGWRSKPASAGQKSLLRKLGIPVDQFAKMSMGEASMMIDRTLAAKRRTA